MMDTNVNDYGSTYLIRDQKIKNSIREERLRWIIRTAFTIILLLAIGILLFYAIMLWDSEEGNGQDVNSQKSTGIIKPTNNSTIISSTVTGTTHVSTMIPTSVTSIATDEEDVKLYNLTQTYFPQDFDQRLSACDKCICNTCTKKSGVKEYRKNLNLTKDEVEESQKKHFPWGLPMSTESTEDILLTQQHYVIGYSPKLHIPLFVGFEMSQENLETSVSKLRCNRRDIRLTQNESSQCIWYYKSGYDRGHLAPSGEFDFDRNSEQDTMVLSNTVPQFPYFNRYGSWKFSQDMIKDLRTKYKKIYVISGTIFDMNNDTIKDAVDEEKNWLQNITGTAAIPTHFYNILTRCNDTVQSNITNCTDLSIMAYIVPHIGNERDILKKISKKDYIKKHICSVQDVEKLTGLSFFTSVPLFRQERLKTMINDL